MSVMSLVAVLSFTMLLVMLTNIVRHIDDKVRMQNAADAAAFSGGVVLARAMNSIAFANQLQSETIALTAVCRALGDRGSNNARRLLPLLQFVLGTADQKNRVPSDRLLPNYQRAVVQLMPTMAQDATNEIALRHGLLKGRMTAGRGPLRFNPSQGAGSRGPQWGVLWRTSAVAVGRENQSDPMTRALPVIDPNNDGTDALTLTNMESWRQKAIGRRLQAATQSLNNWMAQFPQVFNRQNQAAIKKARDELTRLLTVEYAGSNLPFVLRSDGSSSLADYAFIGVAYRTFDREHGPKLFRNPLAAYSDAQAFAQVRIFLPRPRYRCCPWVIATDAGPVNNTDPWPLDWDSFNQTWTAKLCPADAATALRILQTPPPAPANGMRPLQFNTLQPADFDRVNTH
jgi:hypothetical protein